MNIGDPCPLVSVQFEGGLTTPLRDYIAGQKAVIFFYPKDFTPGCTTEVCSFRDNYNIFLSQNCQVIGISGDSDATHNSFIDKHNLNFPLLSDRDKRIRKAFGVPSTFLGLIPGRVTYVFDSNGILQGEYNSQSDAEGHIMKALELVGKID